MKKLFACLAVLLTVILMPAPRASAHVFITDTTGKHGAVLHINPDDDPIAGEQATLYLDTQQLDREIKKTTLTITDQSGTVSDIPVDTAGTLHEAKYTFPKQGSYLITFTLKTIDSSITFSKTQRVTRGLSTGALSRPSYAWARVGLIATGIGFLVLIILVLNRWRDIARQSVM